MGVSVTMVSRSRRSRIAAGAEERGPALFDVVAAARESRAVGGWVPGHQGETAEAQLAAACSAHPQLDASAVVLRGEPVAALRDYVRRLGYEVLVVGTRGEGKTRAMLGSVAVALARGAGIPVLLVDDATAPDTSSSRVPDRART